MKKFFLITLICILLMPAIIVTSAATSENNVAKIGTETYDTLEAAVAAANAMDVAEGEWVLFMDDDDWRAFVEDQRRKGKGQSLDRPGATRQWMEEKCGDIVEIKPGRAARSTGRPAFERSGG